MMQEILENGNGHLPIPSPAPPSDPVEAANILKVYYTQMLVEAEQVVAEFEMGLAKVRAKRDVVKQLADQAALMVQGIQQLQKIGTGAEEVSISPVPAPVPHLVIPDEILNEASEQEEDFDVYFAEEDLIKEESALVLNEDEIPPTPPTATIVIDGEGNIKAKMLPRFEGMTKNAAIAQILEENGDRILHRASIMEEMFGRIDEKEVRKVVVGRVGAALTAGRTRGLWYSDPHNEGFYTSNKNLLKGKKKSPR